MPRKVEIALLALVERNPNSGSSRVENHAVQRIDASATAIRQRARVASPAGSRDAMRRRTRPRRPRSVTPLARSRPPQLARDAAAPVDDGAEYVEQQCLRSRWQSSRVNLPEIEAPLQHRCKAAAMRGARPVRRQCGQVLRRRIALVSAEAVRGIGCGRVRPAWHRAPSWRGSMPRRSRRCRGRHRRCARAGQSSGGHCVAVDPDDVGSAASAAGRRGASRAASPAVY